ncbi:MAG: putative transcriptional regulator [Chloroflexi bacterium]|jgi:DNA-binding NarL/FixJ family response regulator|nr:putative transcriptional regulator [Chloroflexota bacterium]
MWSPASSHYPEALAIRCLIVDDNAQFLEAARSLLEGEGISVVGVASTSADALQQAGRLQPDVALVDIDLGEESGFDLVRLLTDEAGLEQLRVILISTYAEKDFADLIAAGPAAGFVSKSDLSVRAIRAVLRGTAEDQRTDGH